MTNLPALRATLEDIETWRGIAITRYADAFDALQDARDFAARAACSHAGKLFMDDKSRDALVPKYSGRPVGERRTEFLQAIETQTDRQIWHHIIDATNLERLMDRQARDEMRTQLQGDPPPAIADTVRATLANFMLEADLIFRRGIAKVFSSLDRRFKSHDGFKVGSRVILNNAISEYNSWNSYGRHDENLRDIERTFHILDGHPQPERSAGICGMITAKQSNERTYEVESDYFRVRKFANGNIHIWFTRTDLLRRVNRLLADWYGANVLGSSPDVADIAEMGPGYKVGFANNFGLFETPTDIVDRLLSSVYLPNDGVEYTMLEPSAGRGRIANAARDKRLVVTCVEVQPKLVDELRENSHYVVQADFLTLEQDYLPLYDYIVMNPPFDGGRDCDHVRHALSFLKPGGKLIAIMAAGVEFRDDKRTTAFRALIQKHKPAHGRDFFHDLPAGSFAKSGTMVNTTVLELIKR